MRAWWLVLFLASCGRLGFDGATDGGPGEADVGSDVLSFDYLVHNIDAVINVTNVSLSLRTTTPGLTFTVAPDLPAGLSLDRDTGTISGVPTQQVDNAPYVVTGTNASGHGSVTLKVTVLPGYVVASGGDGADTDGGVDTICSTGAGGCSLRAALETTNTHPGKELIIVPPNTNVTMSELPAITDDVEIAGAVDGSTQLEPNASSTHMFRLASIATPVSVTVKNISFFLYGDANGGVFNVSSGTLVVDECYFSDNNATNQGGVVDAANGAHVTFTDSSFSGNHANAGNQYGGVINANGPNTEVVVDRCSAVANGAGWGASRHIQGGTTLLLRNSTVDGNTSTIAGALATPGGVYTIESSTIAYNMNTNTNPVDANSAGLYIYGMPGAFSIANSIIAFNKMNDGSELDCSRRDTAATFVSNYGNIFGDTGGNCSIMTGPGQDRVSLDPLLETTPELDDNFFSATLALKPGSPAIDTAVGTCPPIDERGHRRIGACDVGAYELDGL